MDFKAWNHWLHPEFPLSLLIRISIWVDMFYLIIVSVDSVLPHSHWKGMVLLSLWVFCSKWKQLRHNQAWACCCGRTGLREVLFCLYRFKGATLKGKTYKPLFTYFQDVSGNSFIFVLININWFIKYYPLRISPKINKEKYK